MIRRLRSPALGFVATFAALAMSASAPAQIANGSPDCLALGMAGDLGVVAFGDVNARFGELPTRLAVQGNLVLANFRVGKSLPGDAAGDAIVVGGDIALDDVAVLAGNVVASGDIGGIDLDVIDALAPGRRAVGGQPTSFGFVALRQQLIRKASDLRALPTTGVADATLGVLRLRGDGASAVQVFAVDGQALFDAHTILLSEVPTSATVVINVGGEQSGMRNLAGARLGAMSGRVLFNFHEARRLTFTNVRVEGTVLAPHAVVSARRGRIDGQLVAATVDGVISVEGRPFSSCAADR